MNNSPRVSSVSPYKGHRFPADIISHCVWLYSRFSLRFRDVEDMMAERGVVVSYETIREWCLKFGATYAKRVRAHGPRPGDRWHLDEVYSIPLGGEPSVNAVWTYEAPYAAVATIKDHVAFYPDRVDVIEEQLAGRTRRALSMKTINTRSP
jgi:transposase-like protein